MNAYRILPGDDIDGLSLEDISERPLAPQEVRVKVHAVSLNYRDLMVCKGSYLVNAAYPIIPCSDGAGEVVAVGSAVNRVKPGDRVAASFFARWLDGGPAPTKVRTALGGDIDG